MALYRSFTAAATTKAAPALFEQLSTALKSGEGEDLTKKIKGLVVFKVDDEDWTLDLREGQGSVTKGLPKEKADLTLTINDENFAKLVMGKLNPQQGLLSGNWKSLFLVDYYTWNRRNPAEPLNHYFE
eukprot:jgi/Chrzof1/13306/Cz07g28100.t1